MPVQTISRIVGKEKLIDGIYKFSIESKEISELAKPGNFLEVKVADNSEIFLRRPISIYNIDSDNNVIEFIFQVKGKGTEILTDKKVGDTLDILGPLGNGTFTIDSYKKAYVIGGGIGTYPLYELSKQLNDTTDVTMYMGFRNKDLVTLEDEFKEVSNKLVLCTDDRKLW